MIISTGTEKISSKVWIDSFVPLNLNPHHRMNFTDLINKIAPAVNTGETVYFRYHKGSYYDAMPSVLKNMTVIKSER